MRKLTLFTILPALFVLSACDPRFDEPARRFAGDSGDRDVPTLRPDLPDATSIEISVRIDIDTGDADDLFVPTPPEFVRAETAETRETTIRSWVDAAEDSGIFSPELFVDTDWINTQREFNDASRTIADINPVTAWYHFQRGERIRLFPVTADDGSSAAGYEFVPSFQPIAHGEARVFLQEHYTLSNFVGDYGTGRIVNTFSLLPGETAELRVSTYRDETVSTRSSASILDSSSQDSFESFAETLSEDTSLDTIDRTSSSTAKVRAHGGVAPGFAFGSARADLDSTSNVRRDFHRTVASSVRRTANRASSSRDVYVDTSVESTVEQGREDVSIRTVSNINTGHTLNFISYQMNQQYHSVLHLTDVDIGFDDGKGNITVLPLYQLQRFLDAFVIADKQGTVRERLLAELAAITDFRGDKPADFVLARDTSLTAPSEATRNSGTTVYSTNPEFVSEYEIAAGVAPIRVPGVIVDVQPVVMRTDGVYVEAVVGRSSAWDNYTEQLKAKELRD